MKCARCYKPVLKHEQKQWTTARQTPIQIQEPNPEMCVEEQKVKGRNAPNNKWAS